METQQMSESVSDLSIALVINTYQQAHYLPASIESALKQTVPFDDIIVVDDGSTDNPAAVVAKYPGVRMIRQPNKGLAAARNIGLNAASSHYIAFLDADDLLMPNAVRSGLACHAENYGAGLVYGAYRCIGRNGEALGGDVYREVGSNAFRTLLTGNMIGMHAAVIYDRAKLREIGAFDATLPRCEDYDVYFRMATRYPVVSHPDVAALYRWHGENMSANHSTMLKWVLRVNNRQKNQTAFDPALEADRILGRRVWIRYYANELAADVLHRWRSQDRLLPVVRLAMRAVRMMPSVTFEVIRWALHRARASMRRTSPPRTGESR
jgi:glycosyltransferase involved in cell wall biosynthesis